ncbi:MAG TPA: tryptophan synthase subunit alpha [Steroidobacteraceae bacterium]|nr:tryptophan synthase subunit alpha [Steroidobacteraceae bacterium]HQX78624.1 tryptophan synthase subunit alpha [Steroidobacteraceae bacterium]HQZ80445.1 tryptophan synthase subunit alpha [Steroidobacteraceae bacterium]
MTVAAIAPHERISAAIRRACGRNPALVAFLTAGFPRRELFRTQLSAVAGVADVVEIGVPFTDPMADGLTIQRSSREALAQGVTLRWILDELAAMQAVNAPLLLMSYLNPLLAFGFAELAVAAEHARVAGFIVPDLPFDEGGELQRALEARGIALVQMATPVTTPERLAKVCGASRGFVYAVTMTGTTGKNVAVPDNVIAYLDRVRAVSPVPVCAGFGIRSREQVARLAGHVDGVVVGSALVEVLERGEDPAAWLRTLRPGAG